MWSKLSKFSEKIISEELNLNYFYHFETLNKKNTSFHIVKKIKIKIKMVHFFEDLNP